MNAHEMFKVGDVVRLTCNATLMTVEKIDEVHGTVHVVWMNSCDGEMATAVLKAEVLQPA